MDSPWYTSVAAWWQHGGSMVYPWWSQRFSMFFHLRLDAFDAIFVQPLFVQLRPWTSWTRPSCSLDQFGVFVVCVRVRVRVRVRV